MCLFSSLCFSYLYLLRFVGLGGGLVVGLYVLVLNLFGFVWGFVVVCLCVGLLFICCV